MRLLEAADFGTLISEGTRFDLSTANRLGLAANPFGQVVLNILLSTYVSVPIVGCPDLLTFRQIISLPSSVSVFVSMGVYYLLDNKKAT